MAKTKYKHVKGMDAVLKKLRYMELSIKQRSLELLFYLTASVHFDFISSIVLGEVEEKFKLAPNSICYLLEYKWEKVHHDRLFMLTGGYVKNIQVLNIVDAAKAGKSLTTLIIGMDSGKYEEIAELLERGGGIMSKGSGGATAYTMPERPLWSKYRGYMTGILRTSNWGNIKDSMWRRRFDDALKKFAENIKADSAKTEAPKLDVSQIAKTEQLLMDSYINTNDPKDSMSSSDLIGIAEQQRENRSFGNATWGRILQKFEDLGDTSLTQYADDAKTELTIDYKPQDSDDEGDIEDVIPFS